MKVVFAVFLAIHGVAHLVGFFIPWRLMESPQMPYKTTILGGRFDLGDAGIRAWGMLWLLLAVGFLLAAWGVAMALPGVGGWLAPLTVASLVAGAMSWPDARVGVGVNAVILLILVLASSVGSLPFLG